MANHSLTRDESLEIELLENTGRGDRTSFGQLYERYSGVLFSTAYQVLNDQAESEDVLQDVFVQIWDKARLYDRSRGKPLTWALTMTRNKSIDRLRSAQRRHRLRDEVERETSVFEQGGAAATHSTGRFMRWRRAGWCAAPCCNFPTINVRPSSWRFSAA